MKETLSMMMASSLAKFYFLQLLKFQLVIPSNYLQLYTFGSMYIIMNQLVLLKIP